MQLLTERGQRAMQRLAGIQGPVGQWAASSCLGTSERHLSRATSASSASLHASTLHACRGSGKQSAVLVALDRKHSCCSCGSLSCTLPF